ncbi:MAG TPA: FAD-containing oxidoreductase [Burkholderiales bacterium]|nr:FAD-containing oxidoreductase [Burkholderiales bacterium]
MSDQFDAVVIGAGQAGPSLAVRLAQSGRRTAIVERKALGGTCVNTGCTPTKTLVASARAAHMARRAADYGVSFAGSVAVDMKKVKARKDAVVQRSVDNLGRWLQGTPNLTVIHGHARFDNAHSVRVGDRLLEAKWFFLDTGGRARIPDMPGVQDVAYLTNSSIMALDTLPGHLIIVGGSYVGLEFAQMYRRFGSRVTVVEMGPRLIGREDEDVSDAVRAILEKEGVAVRTGARCISLHPGVNGVAVGLDCNEEPRTVDGTHVLLAVGRTPNTDDLGLEKAGVATDKRGHITVDDELRTGVPGIWALGEVNGRGAFTHTSYNDYEIVAANLLGSERRRVTDRIPTYALFTDPPLGRAGMSEREAKARGGNLLAGKLAMSRVARARERSETDGFMKVVVDGDTKRILGAAILGIEGDEAIHSVLDIMYADVPYTVMQRAVHIHPTVTELIPTMLGDLKPLA